MFKKLFFVFSICFGAFVMNVNADDSITFNNTNIQKFYDMSNAKLKEIEEIRFEDLNINESFLEKWEAIKYMSWSSVTFKKCSSIIDNCWQLFQESGIFDLRIIECQFTADYAFEIIESLNPNILEQVMFVNNEISKEKLKFFNNLFNYSFGKSNALIIIEEQNLKEKFHIDDVGDVLDNLKR